MHPSLSALTDSAFSINTLRKYAINPLSFTHHQYKDLIKLAGDIIRTRDIKEYKTHIGKVKSHTGVPHSDEPDTAAHTVVEGYNESDIVFNHTDPFVGGLRI